MKISSEFNPLSSAQNSAKSSVVGKTLFTEKLTDDEAKELRQQVVDNANAYTFASTNIQSGIAKNKDVITQNYEEFQNFLKDIGYNGKPIAELSQDEAAKLVSEDGIFGIKQTSERIANFVINGAGGNEDLLRAGREGMLQGFKEAEKIWRDKLPDISQQTMQKATELVDKAMSDLGFGVLDTTA